MGSKQAGEHDVADQAQQPNGEAAQTDQQDAASRALRDLRATETGLGGFLEPLAVESLLCCAATHRLTAFRRGPGNTCERSSEAPPVRMSAVATSGFRAAAARPPDD